MRGDNLVAGTVHILRDAHSGSEKRFQWTGRSWSTPGTGWGTKPALMEVLGWTYARPSPPSDTSCAEKPGVGE